jgi:hypothetical protein
MGPGLKNFEQIKEEFERNEGWVVRLHIANNLFLVKEYLEDWTKRTSIGYESSHFEWGQYTFEKYENEDEKDVWKFKVKLYTEGDLILYRTPNNETRKKIKLNLWITTFGKYYEETSYFSYIQEGVTVTDEKLEIVNEYNNVVFNEYNRFQNFEALDFDLLIKLWPHNKAGNKGQAFVTSLDYFNELQDVYRQIRYLLAQAKVHSYYSKQYVKKDYRRNQFYLLHITNHHRRYLDYCTQTIHSIYVYWERLAFLIYQYIQPNKVKPDNLSFVKLIDQILKETQTGKIKRINTNWLEDFIQTYHKKLQDLRHPLVHYKLSDSGGNGSFLARIQTNWLKNISDKQKLLDMEKENQELLDELIDLTSRCEPGYKNIIHLILEYSDDGNLASR